MPALLDIRPPTLASLTRCLACSGRLDEGEVCADCGRIYPEVNGILQAIGPLSGTNRVAAAFYESEAWARFKFWEEVFLAFQGPGQAAARGQVLRHLPVKRSARVLEVGIGDGENINLLPDRWDVLGVDLAQGRLEICKQRFPKMTGRLVRAEAESLPFEDGVFDAVFTVGGINYFRDPSRALREMRRVARPGATLIVADERPDLYRFGLGHILGLEGLDRFWLGLTGLDREFVAMVLDTPPGVEKAAQREWPNHRRSPIWNRLGYCLVDIR